MTATKAQAPTLFGKRMHPDYAFEGWWNAKAGDLKVSVVEMAGGHQAFVGSWQSDKWRKSSQAAARDAERYLRRLHSALGRVCDEGK